MTGAEIAKVRTKLGMTQAEFAEKLGIKRNSLSRIELRDEVTRMTEYAVRYLLLLMENKRGGKK
jgi:transcriptional regulator with XRE-family HTH domain